MDMSDMSSGPDSREEVPRSGLDVCQLPGCGVDILTQCWRGTGACSDVHFKAQHGHARVSEWLQQRLFTEDAAANPAGQSSGEDVLGERERASDPTAGRGWLVGDGSSRSYSNGRKSDRNK